MKDYNTITAELLKNAPHGIDCYVSNVSFADALQDIHCTGDAVKRMKYWGKDSAGEHMLWDKNDRTWKYVIPVHLVVSRLLSGCANMLGRLTADEIGDRDVVLGEFLSTIVGEL